MKYRITHSTVYSYSHPVGLCQNQARLKPRNDRKQLCESSRFEIEPPPVDLHEYADYFGNTVSYFAVQQSHQKLTVTAISEVSLQPSPNGPDPANPVTWEEARRLMLDTPTSWQSQSPTADTWPPWLEAKHYLFDSPMVEIPPELADFAQPSFQPNRPLTEAVYDLMSRIYREFAYDPSFTTVATPLAEVMHHRRGVCQDFAHVAIGCLRAYGIPARYVSGYLETAPKPGSPRLVGADASHAWFSAYVPGSGWLDFDPTNNTMPDIQHITLAWGRDYSDVTPIKGIAYGGGQHSLAVSVDVERI